MIMDCAGTLQAATPVHVPWGLSSDRTQMRAKVRGDLVVGFTTMLDKSLTNHAGRPLLLCAACSYQTSYLESSIVFALIYCIGCRPLLLARCQSFYDSLCFIHFLLLQSVSINKI